MNRELIIKMAIASGLLGADYAGREKVLSGMDEEVISGLESFAVMVAADEREACAETMESMHTWITNTAASAAIRARG